MAQRGAQCIRTDAEVIRESVSVIVPTFNRAKYLRECLDSLLGQTVDPYEIVVVDDGSEDQTRQLVASYGKRIAYIYKENGGKPSAVNLGLAAASGSLIWLFDDDDVALPDAIERRLESLRKKPEAGFVYSPHLLGSDSSDGRIVSGRLSTPPQYADEQFFLEIMKSCFFHLGTVLARREHYQTLRGLDPKLLSGEDYDFQIRLARIARPAFSPSPTFIFRQHAGVRGAKAIRYSASQRSGVFRRYSQAIGLKLKNDVLLREYLTPQRSLPVGDPVEREALLNRMQVMGNHGCVRELVDDLTSLLSVKANQVGLAAHEAAGVAAAIRCGWAYEACVQDWPDFLQSLRGIRRLPGGRAAIWALAKGVLGLAVSYPGAAFERLDRARRAAQLAVAAHM